MSVGHSAVAGKALSVAFSSCRHTTSGLAAFSQCRRFGRRLLMLLMLKVAIFIRKPILQAMASKLLALIVLIYFR